MEIYLLCGLIYIIGIVPATILVAFVDVNLDKA